jgi:GGDEF domain-containing protein
LRQWCGAHSFLVPLAIFVGLYLGGRAIVGHQLLAVAGLWLALVGRLHAGGAFMVALAVGVALLSAAVTVRVLVVSVGRRGAVDPDTGLPNGIGLAQRLSSAESLTSTGGYTPFVMATVHLAGVNDAREALGYQVGTELLRRAVEDLGQVVPAHAVISRVEADELVVTLGVPADVAWGELSNEPGEVPSAVSRVAISSTASRCRCALMSDWSSRRGMAPTSRSSCAARRCVPAAPPRQDRRRGCGTVTAMP